MTRPKKKEYNIHEALAKMQEAGIKDARRLLDSEYNEMASLKERIKNILQIVKDKPIKATEMTYLIMYDIQDNKVRNHIAKYLKKKGCVRIQKSVFLAKTESKYFEEIYDTFKEINSYYENKDSIILVPVNASDVRSMKLIGFNVDIQLITDKPNTLFF